MQQSSHIVIHAHRIHEDERLLSERQGLAVRARCFAFAILQVEQLLIDHDLVVVAESGVDLAEHTCRAIDERVHVRERLEGRSAKRVNRGVPRPELVDLHCAPPPIHDPLDRREDGPLDRLVEPHAVLGRVGEPVLLLFVVVV